ncbi:flippase-like domain-containing protein [Massilia sp. CCM 8695]|uniref:Flippase-like domain-containing protein n=1 Tax=Massilia frigida TaxID=2609281 RepID=A0ABX0N2X2_9BURK|nr:lysylphosphatidylglycerol synthase transmembrane domain-containing protein [Massilia frigida]NHZ79665.1 flippase-like domain-containing protein [Massilia frigida]
MKKILFTLLFALTIYLTARFFSHASGASLAGVLALIFTIPLPLWLGLAALTCLFYMLDWIRLRSMLAVLGHPLRFAQGLKLTCVSYFVTSLTPSAELHTPAMMFMLTRQGVPMPQALAASVSKSIYMTLWICLVSCATLTFGHAIALPAALQVGLPLLTAPLLGIALLLALMAFFPGPVMRWTGRRASTMKDGSLWQKILLGIGQSAHAISAIGKSTDVQHLVCHLASVVFLLTYVTIGWLLATHFGFSLNWLQALTIFSTSLMVAYLAPVPGAIGVAEVATSYMLDPALTPQGMAVSVTLRVLCWYLVAVPGAAVLAREFHRAGAWKLPKVFS